MGPYVLADRRGCKQMLDKSTHINSSDDVMLMTSSWLS